MNLYLVGGAVRDILLGRIPRELDFCFDGRREDFLASHPGATLVGSLHVCLWNGCEFMPLRGASLEEDLMARDLTVNALALDRKGRLLAHPRALDDLRAGILRPASPTAFASDPGRVFRLARFAACWPRWRIAPEAWQQMRRLTRQDLAALPAERVGRELLKALEAPAPGRFLHMLLLARCLAPWFEELERAARVPAGPARWHGRDSVLDHTIRVMDGCAGDGMAAWMALCHDLGKTATPPDLWPHHYGHEDRGVPLGQALAQRLRLSTRHGKAAALACAEHMRAGRYAELRTGTRRDVLWRVERSGFSLPFWKMVDADSGRMVSATALHHRDVLCAVHLPEAWRNRGRESEQHLRDLQCQALAKAAEASSNAPRRHAGRP